MDLEAHQVAAEAGGRFVDQSRKIGELFFARRTPERVVEAIRHDADVVLRFHLVEAER